MPRFHFNVYDGVTILDAEGVELDSFEDARIEAIALAGQMLKDYPERVRSDEDWRVGRWLGGGFRPVAVSGSL